MKSEELLQKVREGFSYDAAKSKITFTDVIQYNITVDGQIEKTVTIDFKNFKFIDGAVDASDIEITIDDDLFVELFKGGLKLVNLHAEVIYKNKILLFFF